MTEREIDLWRKFEKRGCLGKSFRPSNCRKLSEPGKHLLNVYDVSVEKCFRLPDFNEELPLYILDVGGTLLILFGQWLYDPNIVLVLEESFERWDVENSFFKSFTIRWSPQTGDVYQFNASDASFIEANRLTASLSFKYLRECMAIPGRADTLIEDMRRAGVVAPRP